jgi:hypothetical protein
VGRAKDIEFCNALIKRKLVNIKTLEVRLKKVRNLKPELRTAVAGRIKGDP